MFAPYWVFVSLTCYLSIGYHVNATIRNHTINNTLDNFYHIFNRVNNFDVSEILESISRFLPIHEQIENKKCRENSQNLLKGFKNLEPWAVRMVDASAKLQSGLLDGNIKNFGQYDECVKARGSTFSGQYCLVNVHVEPLPGAPLQAETARLLEMMTLGGRRREVDIYRNNVPTPDLLPSLSHMQMGVCVPSSCSSEDVQLTLNTTLLSVATSVGLQVSVFIPEGACSIQRIQQPLTSAEFAVIALLWFLVGLGVAGMIYDKIHPDTSQDSTSIQVLRAFSISANWKRLFTINKTPSPQTFPSLDGIRVLSTVWVVIAHKIFYFLQEPWINKYILVESVTDIAKMPVINNMQSVDSFFMTSGLLRGFNLMRDFENNRHDFVASVWKRYLRLTPAYAIMILYYATLMNRLADGPVWHKQMAASTNCQTNWIYNLLYLNNYMHGGNHCMIQTWYLAADFQLFILAPLLMYPVWRWPHLTRNIFLIAGSIATLIPFMYTILTSALPTYLPSGSDFENLRYQTHVHFPTHNRGSSYIVGLAIGLLMFKIGANKPKLSKMAVLAGWAGSLFVLYEIIFGAFNMMQYDYKYQPLPIALYGAMQRPAWALGVAWIVYACQYGYGGWINGLLTAYIHQPLSKLSYCVFLTHYLVLMVGTGRIHTALYMDEYGLLREVIADWTVIIVVSTILHILVEAPTLELTKLLQNKGKNTEVKKINESEDHSTTNVIVTDLDMRNILKTKQG